MKIRTYVDKTSVGKTDYLRPHYLSTEKKSDKNLNSLRFLSKINGLNPEKFKKLNSW